MCVSALLENTMAVASSSPPSPFLPAVGQTAYYRYLDTVTTPDGTRGEAATLTLTTVSESQIHVTIAVDGQALRSLDFRLDPIGGFQPVCTPEAFSVPSGAEDREDRGERRAAAQTLIFRLSLAAHIRMAQGADVSFPVQLTVPGATGPANPILSVKASEPDAFVADTNATMSVTLPEKKRGQRLPLLLGGAGLVAGAVSGKAGRIVALVGAGGALVSNLAARRPPPQKSAPVDVNLHVTGQFADGRLRILSGDQESVVHAGKHIRTLSDKWSLTTT